MQFPARLVRTVPAMWIAVLLLPSLVWIFADHRVWPWDPGYYGYWTLRLLRLLTEGQFQPWYSATIHALGIMPPLLVWVGQFFAPLRHLTGDVESALLLLNICAAAGTLTLVYKIARDFERDGDMLCGLAAASVCGSASLFIGLTHHYFTEPLQTLTSALAMVMVYGAQHRSGLRNFAFAVILTSLGLLAKASSVVFVLPALTYMGVALLATWSDDKRPRIKRADVLWLGAGIAAAFAAIGWYTTNKQAVMLHVVQATIGAEIKSYWEPAPFLTELRYWIAAFAEALAATPAISALFALACCAGLVVAARELRDQKGFLILRKAVNDSTLFGYYLAGTIAATIFVYALQINRDPRFLAPIIPMAAVLVGWALVVLRQPIFAILVLTMATATGVTANMTTFGLVPSLSYTGWLWPVDGTTDEKNALTRVVAATCVDEAQPSVIGVSYPWTNGNSANFYAEKQRLKTGVGCEYSYFSQNDVPSALAWLDTVNARFVVTIAPERQDLNFANTISKPIAEALASDNRFALMPESDDRFKLYKRTEKAEDKE